MAPIPAGQIVISMRIIIPMMLMMMTWAGVEAYAAPQSANTESDPGFAVDSNGYGTYLTRPPTTCPPINFAAYDQLDLEDYLSERWYVQAQMPVQYLDASSNYCVTAKYRKSPKQSPPPAWTGSWFAGPFFRWLRYTPNEVEVDVFNYANRDCVNGDIMVANLSAVLLDPVNEPGQLLVGPWFVPRVLWGPYWVIQAGGSDHYKWAIISGGPPKIRNQTTGYCQTGDGVNDSGLWIFTRDPTPSAELVQKLVDRSQSYGFDVSVLKPVQQAGCLYAGVQNI